MRTIPALALTALLPLGLAAHQAPKGQGGCCDSCCCAQDQRDRAVARATAEAHTGGRAVSASLVRINGSTRWGYAVLVHMPGKDKGWRCLVDMDGATKVYSKSAIPNPPAPKDGAED